VKAPRERWAGLLGETLEKRQSLVGALARRRRLAGLRSPRPPPPRHQTRITALTSLLSPRAVPADEA